LPPARQAHHGRSRRFETVRIAAWRSRDDKWHEVEDIEGNKMGRYPTQKAVGSAKVIIIMGEVERSPDGGATWQRTGENKFLTTHTPFTKRHSIDDFAQAAADYYEWRFR
jgi:hypothetical protein